MGQGLRPREVFYKTKIGGLIEILFKSSDPIVIMSIALRIVEELANYYYESLEGNLVVDYSDWEWTVVDRVKKYDGLYQVYSRIIDSMFEYAMGFDIEVEGIKMSILELIKRAGLKDLPP